MNLTIQDTFTGHTYSNTPHLFANLETYARVVNIYDGDTCTITFKVGDMFYKHNIRLNGIDTCEIRSKNEANKQKAQLAKHRLIELVTQTSGRDTNLTKKQLLEILNNQVYLVYIKVICLDKYGRLLCDMYSSLPSNLASSSELASGKSFSDILLAENLAYAYGGGTKLAEAEQLN